MKIRTRYYQQYDADYALPVPEAGFGGWQTGEVDLDPQHTALVVMHAWDCGTPEQYPGWFRCCAEILETYRVCREVLPPLLTAVRTARLPVFHVVCEGKYYLDYPGYKRTVALAGPDPASPPRVEPDPTWTALQQFRSDNVFVGKHNQADVDRGWAQVKFPREAEPVADEAIAKNAHQLGALCRAAGVNHLVYTGFNLDWCLLMSEGGMVDMSRRGVICSTLRQAVTAVESKESAPAAGVKEIGLWRVSVAFGFVFDVPDFIAALAPAPASS